MALKTYSVYFFEKKNKSEYLSGINVTASNAKEACSKAKEWFKATTGRNAFRPTINLSLETAKIYSDRIGCYYGQI